MADKEVPTLAEAQAARGIGREAPVPTPVEKKERPLYVLQPALGLYLTATSFAGLAVLGFLGIKQAPTGQLPRNANHSRRQTAQN